MTEHDSPDDALADSLLARTERGTHRGADAVFDAASDRRPSAARTWMAAAAGLLLVIGGVIAIRTTRGGDATVSVGGTAPLASEPPAGSDPDTPPTAADVAAAPTVATTPGVTAPTDTVESAVDGAVATTPGTIVDGERTATTPPPTGPPATDPPTTDTPPATTTATTIPATTADTAPPPTTTLVPDPELIDPSLLFESGAIVATWNEMPGKLIATSVRPQADTGTTLRRTAETVPFDGDRLVVEFSVTAGNQTHGSGVWTEIVLTPASTPTDRRPGALFATDVFGGEWTLGCRLEAARTPVCALMNDSELGVGDGGREWQMSFFEMAGTTSFGGEPGGERGDAWRTCPAIAPSEVFDFGECLDRFRLEVTRTSLTLFVNDVRYFEQTGLPPVPDELLTSSYAYRAVSQSRSDLESVVVFWSD